MPKKIERRQSSIHGNGVFATEAIAKGERVVRYKGEVRKHADVDAEYAGHDETGHTFLFSLNDEWVIDANRDGNVARWINHSCAPNCEAVQEENAKGKKHKDKVFIHALRDIAPGEELSYNYGIVIDEPYTPALKKLWECRCGSAKCTGTMLQPKARPKPEKRAAKKPSTKTPSTTKPATTKPATGPAGKRRAKAAA
jgi:SET domain-containing protein